MKIVAILLCAISAILADECNEYCPKPTPEGCCERLGLNYYRDSDVIVTASSSWDADHGPHRSGLFTTRATGPIASWSARTNDVNQWIQADFGTLRQVTGILLQGRGECDCDQWVTSFRVLFSNDGEVWYSTEPLVGTYDRDTVQRRYFDRPIVARYFRVNPLDWHNHVSLRFDFIGCDSE